MTVPAAFQCWRLRPSLILLGTMWLVLWCPVRAQPEPEPKQPPGGAPPRIIVEINKFRGCGHKNLSDNGHGWLETALYKTWPGPPGSLEVITPEARHVATQQAELARTGYQPPRAHYVLIPKYCMAGGLARVQVSILRVGETASFASPADRVNPDDYNPFRRLGEDLADLVCKDRGLPYASEPLRMVFCPLRIEPQKDQHLTDQLTEASKFIRSWIKDYALKYGMHGVTIAGDESGCPEFAGRAATPAGEAPREVYVKGRIGLLRLMGVPRLTVMVEITAGDETVSSAQRICDEQGAKCDDNKPLSDLTGLGSQLCSGWERKLASLRSGGSP